MPGWGRSSLPPWCLPALGYFGFALLLGEAVPAWVGTVSVTDYETFYRPVAESVARGDGLRTPDGEPAVRYPPGFPLLLAAGFATVGEPWAARLLNALAMTGAAVLLFLIARRLAGERAGWAAAALWTLYPPNWLLLAGPFSEPSFCMLLYLAVWWRMEGRGWPTGVALGLAMLVRPIAILLPLVFLTRKTALPLLAGCLLTVLPWEIWAHRETGRWLPLADGGTETMLDGLMLASNQRNAYRGAVALPDGARRVSLAAEAHARKLNSPVAVASFLLDQKQLDAAQLLAVKAARAWYATDSGRFDGWLAGLQAVLLGLAVRGARRLPRAGLLLAITAYFWGMTILAYSMLRYMLPAMGLLLVCAGAGHARPRTDR